MLFTPFKTTALQLSNRVVMSPLTRCRATPTNVPTALMAEYYSQRATAGLIIAEGTSPSPNGLGYPRMPGLFNAEQADGWKQVVNAVHAKGGRLFIQLMHTGRVTYEGNLPKDAEVLGPSAEQCPGEIFTDAQGMQPHSMPKAMTQEDIAGTVEEYVKSAKLAIDAGADGIELHAANGYLIEQFLNANVNKRTDAYGASIEGRNRFALEVARATVAAVGADKVGIRLSPYGVLGATGAFAELDAQYLALVEALSSLQLAYIHVLDHSAMGTPPVPSAIKQALRAAFNGTFMLAGGFDKVSAEAAITEGHADLVAFGRPFISNPDWVARMQAEKAGNALDMTTFYTPGPKGYTDYPTLGA